MEISIAKIAEAKKSLANSGICDFLQYPLENLCQKL